MRDADDSEDANSADPSESGDEAVIHKIKEKYTSTKKRTPKDEHSSRQVKKKGAQTKKLNLNDEGDNMNYKRSIEIKNGIPMRSMNNFHKTTNAINLNNYVVSNDLPLTDLNNSEPTEQ